MSGILKPCAKCNGKANEAGYLSIEGHRFTVYCSDCKHENAKGSDSSVKAIEIWNSEPRIDELQSQLVEYNLLIKQLIAVGNKAVALAGWDNGEAGALWEGLVAECKKKIK